jgi:hypothetical protein
MRRRTGHAHIDASITQLEVIDFLSNDLFMRRTTPEHYRERISRLIAGMDEQTVRMFAAVYVDENQLDEGMPQNN